MSQTLAGHIEDLALDEVVRVIALSKRSGALTIESPEDNAEVIFEGGRIVSARRSSHSDSVADLLLQKALVTEDDLARVNLHQVDLYSFLNALEATPPANEKSLAQRVDELLSERLLDEAATIIGLRKGRFSFQVLAQSPLVHRLNDTNISLSAGIDSGEVTRLVRARRDRFLSGPHAALKKRERTPALGSVPIPEVLLCSRDEAFKEHAMSIVSKAGLAVRLFDHVRDLVAVLPELEAEQPKRAVVTDLVQARSHGRGILGGLEVLQKAADIGFADRVVLMLQEAHKDAEHIAAFMGAGEIVLKTAVFADPLTLLNPVLVACGREEASSESLDLVGRLHKELNVDEQDSWHPVDDAFPAHNASLAVLKTLLDELNDPKYEEEIPLLVLRFASAFFSRGALFQLDANKQSLKGIGGFGLDSPDVGRAVNSIKMRLDENSIFARSLTQEREIRQPYFANAFNDSLLRQLGGPIPREVYTAPLMSSRGVEALLYADNAIDLRAFPNVELLEIFLQQSGAALERWSLKREIDELRKRLPATIE